LQRKSDGKENKKVGEVIGVDVPYEEPEKPDLVIDSQLLNPKESSAEILELLKLNS
jgi:adenylylsulfate kinase-like enzyme